MSFPRKTPIVLAFFALSALAAAVGCSREEDASESASSDVTGTGGALQDLVISQVYGGGGNNGAKFTNDFIELFNQGDHPVELAGKTLQYVSAGGSFAKSKNILTLPPATAQLEPGHYFLIQVATGAATGATPVGDPLTDVDYVATQSAELISMSKESGKVALVATPEEALEACGSGDPDAGACGDTKFIDLVGYGGASQFRGAAPVPALSTGTAAVRRFGGCAHSGDNSFDFEAIAPAPRNSKTPPSTLCATVDASAPLPPPAPKDAGTKADAGPKPPKPPKADSGAHATKDAGKKGTTGDDDDDGEPVDPGDGDDDDDSTAVRPTKKASPENANNGVAPPAFPATSPDCSMTPGPLSSSSGLGAIFGLALAGAALRRRR